VKKHLLTFMLALFVGVLGFAVSGVAVAGNGQPPGQGDCSHGSTGKDCKSDPSDNGKDCEAHGNKGGVNEDHCQGDTTPTETTPTETTPTETTPTDTTPTETTPTETTPTTSSPPPATTPQETTPQETTPEQPVSQPESPKSPPSIVGTPPKAQKSPAKSAVAGISKSNPKPTRQAQPAPFTL
jgi:hypothetical protein